VIPVYGRQDLTHALLEDVLTESSLVQPLIIDNGGDYQPLAGETVLRQTENLGWLRGTNVGLRHALSTGAPFVVLLNNDTRLSRGFFAGLLAAANQRRVGVVGPRYDDHWHWQHLDHAGPASEYVPVARERRAPFIDGTCVLVRSQVLARVGLLDEQAFGETGWGADIDLAVRARKAGWRVVVSDRAFLHHATSSTAVATHGDNDRYWSRGDADLRRGLEEKWGPDWQWICGLTGRRARATHYLRRMGLVRS
jgi:GT2 family glycosyltransferase